MNDGSEKPSATGQCLCGAVAYELRGPLRDVINCHCGQCRRTHGHFAAYTNVSRAQLRFVADSGLKWFESSKVARRGFCGGCGASLFWERTGSGTISVAAGTLNHPTGLMTRAHIFVDDKGDYYELNDSLKTYPGTMGRTCGAKHADHQPADVRFARGGTAHRCLVARSGRGNARGWSW